MAQRRGVAIEKFRVKNYKSILDSGNCDLTESVTILAGKNESGKTSLLEALEDFSVGNPIRRGAVPILAPDSIPEISITFKFDKNVIKDILKEIDAKDKRAEDTLLEITKFFPSRYSFTDLTRQHELFGKSQIEEHQNLVTKKWKEIRKIAGHAPGLIKTPFDFEFKDLKREMKLFSKFRSEASFPVAMEALKVLAAPKGEVSPKSLSSLMKEIESSLQKLILLSEFEEKFLGALQRRIPNFVLFSSFDERFPDKVALSELSANDWIRDLAVISNLDVQAILSTDSRLRQKHKNVINLKLNEHYSKFWTQDIATLKIEWDSNELSFWFEEDGQPYEPSLRSKGRQWHLAFYVRISARASEGAPNVILIDEPGLFLHAKAQEDILKKLTDSSKETQIVFSTHSPYLLEPDKLHQIRLVQRSDKEGTVVLNKVHARANKETLTPILTAIGLEMNAGIASLDKLNNVVVEGASDLYYLNAFKVILNRNEMNFIYGGGSGNMPFVGTILQGWGTNVIYLYDNDQGGSDGGKNLRNNWLVAPQMILEVLERAGTIEDLFSENDFRTLVLDDSSRSYSGSNSAYLKNGRIDKVLMARRFLESSKDSEVIQLDSSTLGNITKLFDNLAKRFETAS